VAPLPRPLEDITVLDLTAALAGPFATLVLAGLGARVIKVENPHNPDSSRSNPPYLGPEGGRLGRRGPGDVSISAIGRLRNKLGVTLDLKAPGAREVFADLLRNSDVLVENFSPGTMDRLGVGYEFARDVNPRLVYCSLTGFGSDADASAKAVDTIIQALSGLMLVSGLPGDPPVRVGIPIADLCAPLFCVAGVLAALHQARRTGQGQHVDVSMLGAMTALVAAEPLDLMERCGVPARTGATMPRLAPFGVFPAADGFVAICAHTDAFAHALFGAMGRPELVRDPRYASRDARVERAREVDALVEGFTRSRSQHEILRVLAAAGVPAGEVRGPAEAVADPQVLARGETVPLEHPRFGSVESVYGMGLPIRFSRAAAGFDRPAPDLGEHNAEVYCGILGYSAERLEALKAAGLV
jgi:crotonobetainyl-CoA:carnitine CoA-transferase CaiB-like acyl-CoA transferase